MLIIPAENTINWKRPPWMTLGLMLTCLLVFLFYQSDDPRLMAGAVKRYLDTNLLQLETPVYETYLQRQIELEGESARVRDLQAVDEAVASNARVWLAVQMLSDRAFFHYMETNRSLIWSPGQQQAWQEQRLPIQQEFMDRLSANQLGLTPASLHLSNLVTYQFLHGGWGHIIGNLVFLFLLGFTVEKALGAGRFLLAYLLCGVLSGLVFTAFSLNSPVPLVGASGSISGLMGMYVAIYGIRRIRFFYFLGVYFDYFRAPALALLPVWVAKEVYDYWSGDAPGVAYMAHAGGLLAGAALVLALGKSWLQVRETFFEPEEGELDERFTAAYAQAMASIARMEFRLAQPQFEALRKQYPDRPVLLEHLYQLAKLRPDQPAYRDRARELMQQTLSNHQWERLVEVWQEYLSRGAANEPLSAEDHNRVLFACLRHDDLKNAEKAFERLRSSADTTLIPEACRLLAEEFEKRQMLPKARHYRELLPSL